MDSYILTSCGILWQLIEVYTVNINPFILDTSKQVI